MKFYNSTGPNPHAVRIFMAEKGIEIPRVEIDLMAGENRRQPYLSKNSAGQMPTLELDDGQYVSEIIAICEYLEEIHPAPPLIGTTPEERAECRKWTRRVDLNVFEPILNGFRFGEGLPLFKDRIVTVPEASAGLKRIAQDRLKWLDGEIAGKDYLCGARFTLADILLFAGLDFGRKVGQPLDPAFAHLGAWFDRMKSRPSAKA